MTRARRAQPGTGFWHGARAGQVVACALSVALLAAGVACGRYGPPSRQSPVSAEADGTAQAQAQAQAQRGGADASVDGVEASLDGTEPEAGSDRDDTQRTGGASAEERR